MRALVLSVLLAACAGSARAESAMAPFAPLMGCWRGAFEGNANIHDERCFEPMLDGRYVRDVHSVRPTAYGGETIYFADTQAGALGFVDYASDGGISRGAVRVTEAGLAFDPHTYVGADGRTQRLRSTWTIESADRFVVVSEREQGGTWRPWGRIAYVRMTQSKRPGLRRAFVLSLRTKLSWRR